MALNASPAMTQAPTQAQQGPGNTAVSSGSLRPGEGPARYRPVVVIVAELFDRGNSWLLGSVVGFSDRIVLHRLGCTCRILGIIESTRACLLAACLCTKRCMVLVPFSIFLCGIFGCGGARGEGLNISHGTFLRGYVDPMWRG